MDNYYIQQYLLTLCNSTSFKTNANRNKKKLIVI